MADNIFRDFIPAGEDTGAQGSGFRDFVPEAVPQVHPEEEVKQAQQEVTPEPVKPVTPVTPFKKGK